MSSVILFWSCSCFMESFSMVMQASSTGMIDLYPFFWGEDHTSNNLVPCRGQFTVKCIVSRGCLRFKKCFHHGSSPAVFLTARVVGSVFSCAENKPCMVRSLCSFGSLLRSGDCFSYIPRFLTLK